MAGGDLSNGSTKENKEPAKLVRQGLLAKVQQTHDKTRWSCCSDDDERFILSIRELLLIDSEANGCGEEDGENEDEDKDEEGEGRGEKESYTSPPFF